MNKPTSEQIAKLPKWAQKYIAHIEMVGRYNQRYIRDLQHKNQESYDGNVWIGEEIEDRKVLLPDRGTIHFQCGNGWPGLIRVRKEDGYLDVNAGRTLMVAPRAANVVHLYSGDYT